MNKKVIGIFMVIFFLTSTSIMAIQQKIDNKEHFIDYFSFSNPQIMDEGDNSKVIINGAPDEFVKNDYYIIPSRLVTYTFPFGTKIDEISCTVKNIKTSTLTKPFKVAPEPVLLDKITIPKNLEETKEYKKVESWYDYRISCGLVGNERIISLTIELFPIQYRPNINSFQWAESLTIDIEYSIPNKNINYFDEEYDLIILTPSDFTDELSSLVSHKNNRGIETKLVTLDEIYDSTYYQVMGRDNPEKIKYFIKNTVEKWNTRFVLIVGGYGIFPIRMSHIYKKNLDMDDPFASDLYYADIYNASCDFCSWDSNENDIFGEFNWGVDHLYDEVDMFPDVYLGRIPCVNASELITCVNKIINYENNDAYTQEWFKNLVVLGGDTFPDPDWPSENVSEGEYLTEKIIDVMDGFVPIKRWASEGNLNTKNDINIVLNNGSGFVCFTGHGAPAGWGTHPLNEPDIWIPEGGYTNIDALSLTNGCELPIVVIFACSTANYIEKSDCFAWSFLSNPEGGGIGSFGATMEGFACIGKETINKYMGKLTYEIFNAYASHDAFTFGELWAMSIYHYSKFSHFDVYDHNVIQEWQPFGDPSLLINKESQPPNTPNPPVGPTSGKKGNLYYYNVSTVDPEGDKISYLFDWGDGEVSVWSDYVDSGDLMTMGHIWVKRGVYQVRVKARDYHRVQSEWSDPLSVSIPKYKAFNPFIMFLERLIGRFPILGQILQPVYDKLTGF